MLLRGHFFHGITVDHRKWLTLMFHFVIKVWAYYRNMFIVIQEEETALALSTSFI